MNSNKAINGNSRQVSTRNRSSRYRSSAFFAQTFDAAAIKVKSRITPENAEANTVTMQEWSDQWLQAFWRCFRRQHECGEVKH
jgi:hypothetical protein